MKQYNNGIFCGPCHTCKCEMWLPMELYDAAMCGHETITFYCAYGHGQVFFSRSGSDLDETGKLKAEIETLRSEIAQLKQTE